jgi:hypothetical protein
MAIGKKYINPVPGKNIGQVLAKTSKIDKLSGRGFQAEVNTAPKSQPDTALK